MVSRDIFINQLRRQSRWLSESRAWIIEEKLGGKDNIGSSLDVGCGPGFTIKEFNDAYQFNCVGVDSDQKMLQSARALELEVAQSDAHKLPFQDSSFDLVHCTFTLMWLSDPISVLREMKRVSKKWVVCFAEPDYGARVDFPDSLSELPWTIVESIKKDGGNPYTGRKLRGYFSLAKMESEIGVYDSVWSIEQLESEFRDEWEFLRASSTLSEDQITRLEKDAKSAIKSKIRMQFTPIFYGIAQV
jgi:SAM-dependent methyltransferase